MERLGREQAGMVMLEVRFSRIFPVAFVLLGFGLVAGCMTWIASADRSTWTSVQWSSLAFAVVLGLLVGAAGVRQLVVPACLLTATDRGVLLHLDGNRYLPTGFLLPWKEIADISIETVKAWQGDHLRRFHTIALRLRPGSPPVPSAVSYGPGDSSLAAHVDASSGNLRGEELLRRLTALHRRFGTPGG